MRTKVTAPTRLLVIGALAAGWVIGLLGQWSIVESTGYADISPGLLVLGVLLCMLAGAASHVLAPAHRQMRTGAIAGIAMAASMVGGYLLLVLANWERFPTGTSGETWWTLLLESWFWIGIPLFVSATFGMAGWVLTEALDRSSHRVPPGPASRQGT